MEKQNLARGVWKQTVIIIIYRVHIWVKKI